jgi:signal transduction histidine kinase
MTPPLAPDPSNPFGSVARTLYDIAQCFDWPLDPEPRLRRALRLLRRIVPYDRCGLLDTPAAGAPRLVVEPDAAEEREGISRILRRFLSLLTDETHRATDRRPADVARGPLWASPAHLAVPLVGLDRVLGVLFVRGTEVYTDDHLRLLSVVAAQIAAYLTTCRLREQEAQMVTEHEAARSAADVESRSKDEFLAVLARELRKLLTPIQFAMLTIRSQAERDPAVQRARDAVERQVEYLTRLLDDLLDVSRLGRDKLDLQKESLTLQTIVTEALETTLGFADARRHRVTVSLPEDPLWLQADSGRLTQVVANLLENAAKFTRPGGEVSVIGYREGSEIVLRVRDSGVGIAPEMLPLVFDLCAQGDRSLPDTEEGLGVGLTLARILVELHGGSINAHSEGPDQGSEFVVRLPIGAAGPRTT